MGIIEILLTSLGLAMDAFAVAVCKGLSMKKFDKKKSLIIGIYFGVFQGLMPLIGYLLGTTFQSLITSIDHWIAFILLGFIGGNMLKEGLSKECEKNNDKVDFKTMLPLAIATSIDALAVGITFAFLKVNIVFAVLSIGIITFVMSYIGVKIGNKFGNKYEKKAQLLGGIILILIGTKILLEHLGVF
ncbi:MAG: manganese efflux pump [Bacilli bacterium]|nr:manganese efflux pump [Bacilli bacterium]MBQ3511820.1 manganese efflux pump [Bacilli bacterium]